MSLFTPKRSTPIEKENTTMFKMQEIGSRIAEARRAQGMTQPELAEKMGISFQAVSNWERGESMPDIAKLPELAAILGMSIDALLGAVPMQAQTEPTSNPTPNPVPTPDPAPEPAPETPSTAKPDVSPLKQLRELAKHLDSSATTDLLRTHIEAGDLSDLHDLSDLSDLYALGETMGARTWPTLCAVSYSRRAM